MKIKSILLSALFVFISSYIFSQTEENKETKLGIIPEPYFIEIGYDSFKINNDTKIIVVSDNSEIKDIAEYFTDQFNLTSGYSLKVSKADEGFDEENSIVFTDKNLDTELGEEGYALEIEKDKIVISGTPRGLFYGVQTLFQLLPPYVYGDKPVANIDWSVPSVTIKDKPRFEWRGMHLDVGRHMFPVSFIKKYIDYLAMHKLNA
ncbi:MAG: family 20 glycosylhydrolase, partial [Chlorobi bacterium]|nr:family 20 glycosylhydrolase [Chlorobiota bacterium]